MKRSVCLSCHSTAAVACGGFAAERRAGRRHRSTAAGAGDLQRRRSSTALSSKRKQCRVYKPNTTRLHHPESTGSCRRSAWSAFPPLCSDQSSAGAVRETAYRRRPAFAVAGPTIWNSLPDNVISAPSLSTFRQRLRTFLFQASFPDIIIDPR